MSCSRHSCRGWGCVRARVYTILETLHVASLRGRFFFNVVISFWDSFSLNVHHQYTVHSNNLLPWFLSWMWKYWLLVSFWVTGGLGRVTARCGGISSVMGKFSILPYFFLRLFRGFLGIREQRRRGEGERERARGDGRVSSFLYFRQMHLVQSHRCSTDYLRLSPPSTESPPVPPFLSRVINSIEHLE